MKKLAKIRFLFIILNLLIISTALPKIIYADRNSLTEEQVHTEKDKALKAGYSEEQFNQIMDIPILPESKISQSPSPYAMTNNQTKVVDKAKEQLGKPYVWGASGPDSFDCGGLVKYVYKQAVNIDLPMGTTNQEKYGTEVSLNSLQPGDLLFYGSRGSTYHVGIYIGNGQMIHAPQPGQNVTTVNIQYFYPSFARRILSSEPDYPYINYDKTVTATKAWSIWTDLQWSQEIKKATIGDVYKIGKVYTVGANKYGEIVVNGKTYGYINFDAVAELKTSQINKYVTFSENGENFWNSLDLKSSQGKTERGRIYYITISYNTADNIPIYSVYTDETKTTWLGYYKSNKFQDTPITNYNNTRFKIVKADVTIWSDLNFTAKVSQTITDDIYTVNRKFYNFTNNAYYYELYRKGKIYGYVNADAASELTTSQVNKYVTFSENGEDFWTSLDLDYSNGKTERGRIYYLAISYNTAKNPIYSVYTDETKTTWLGYYKSNKFQDTPITNYNNTRFKIVKADVTIWSDLNFTAKVSQTVTDDIYTVNRKFYNFTNNAYYYELYRKGKIYGYVNADAASELTTSQVNKYVTFSENGEDFWTSLDLDYSNGKTERGRIYYLDISYNTAKNPIYSVYTDETKTTWLGYYNSNQFQDTEITTYDNAAFTIIKEGFTIWSDLNFKAKVSQSVTGDVYTVNRKFYNFTNNAYYYELYKDGSLYGFINSDAAERK